MTDLVTLDEAKRYLRVEHDTEDDTIALLISAVSDAVRDMASDWDGSDPVPDRLKLAVLGRIAETFDHRTSLTAPKGETGLVLPLRKLDL